MKWLILIFVVTLHIGILYVPSKTPTKELNPPKKIVVNTIQLKPKVIHQVKAPIQKPKPKPKPKPIQHPKKTIKKPPQSKTTEIKISQPIVQTQNEIAVEITACNEKWVANLVSYLKESLHLPEYGKVKIRLIILPDGKIETIVILSSESEKNKTYLEMALTKLIIPTIYQTRSKQTLTLTFCNE